MIYIVKIETENEEQVTVKVQGSFHLAEKVYGALVDVRDEYKYKLSELLEEEDER